MKNVTEITTCVKDENPNFEKSLEKYEVFSTILRKIDTMEIFKKTSKSVRLSTTGFSPIAIPNFTGCVIRLTKTIRVIYETSRNKR